MNNEIQLISDGDGLAIVGEPRAVERFVAAEGLSTQDLGLPRLKNSLKTGSVLAQAGSDIAAQSGRWMKLTDESAKTAKKYPMVKNSTSGNHHATLRAEGGKFVKNLQFENGLGAVVGNPALLAGAAGLMAQLAMQQTMDEITDYLAAIDAKVDDVLRAQKDAVLADMAGAALMIDEAMTIRTQVGRVSDVTWSKIQGTASTIARTQSYALLQLDGLAEKLEGQADFGDLAKAARAAETKTQEWLVVLARCFQLNDALAVLELDRVLASAADDWDQHRLGLKIAREKRLETFGQSTERLLTRIHDAADIANAKVLMHPAKAPAIVRSSNHTTQAIGSFEHILGIESALREAEARRWSAAAGEVRDKTLEATADGMDSAKRFGNEALGRAKMAKGKLAERRPEFRLRRQKSDAEVPAED